MEVGCWQCWLVWAAGELVSGVAGGVGELGAVMGSGWLVAVGVVAS